MSKYVPDILSRRWVIVATQRLARPENVGKTKKTLRQAQGKCPFCPGNEGMTPGEVFRLGAGEKDRPGWQVRVIPNKFPITDFHEVIIHSPSETLDIHEMPISHVELLIKAYRERFNFYRKKGQVLIFCNHGEHSGASLKHPHSQLVLIPAQINLDTLTREPLNNIVEENDFFHVYCPDFSQWPYEVWIAPKKENTIFGDLNDEEIKDLAGVLQKTIKQLKHIFDHHPLTKNMTFAYNYYLYPKENWYWRIIPRFIHRAGFELGTGLSVNAIDPTEAARQLRGEEEKMTKVMSKLKKLGK